MSLPMNNFGDEPLQVPGFGDVPLDYELPCEDRFAHGFHEWCQVPAVTACELKMVAAMNKLTDKPNWHVDILDPSSVSSWRCEILSEYPDLGEQAWDWCMAELRDKAVDFARKGYIRVLDTGSSVCKSDSIVNAACKRALESEMNELYRQVSISLPPGEQIIVDPSVFPLVYGKTRTLRDNGSLNLFSIFASRAETKRAPGHFDPRTESSGIQREIEKGSTGHWSMSFHRFNTAPKRYFWSSNFQSLPCEIRFNKNGGTQVSITSYINNLHPGRKCFYRNIEHLISAAIEPWNECLIKGQKFLKTEDGTQNYADQTQRGRVPLRIVTFGVKWKQHLPRWALSLDHDTMHLLKEYSDAKVILRTVSADATGAEKELRAKAYRKIYRHPWLEGLDPIPEPSAETWDLAKEYLERSESVLEGRIPLPEGWKTNAWKLIEAKYNQTQGPEQPQPGKAFSYDDWRNGRHVEKAIVNMISLPHFATSGRPSIKGPTHERYTLRLQDTFRELGLQVIVKIGGIELTPDAPRYEGGPWRLAGLLNEHIVATAMYVCNAENVTPCLIDFRQETPMASSIYRYEQGNGVHCKLDNSSEHHMDSILSSKWSEICEFADIFGLDYNDLDWHIHPFALPYQNLGGVEMRQGRLITFANTIEHRVKPFELIDTTRSGYHRCITLYLVDPNYRICSTRNVPAQQPKWWTAAASNLLVEKGLPRELADKIVDFIDDWPVNERKSEKIKRQIAKELAWCDLARHAGMAAYNF